MVEEDSKHEEKLKSNFVIACGKWKDKHSMENNFTSFIHKVVCEETAAWLEKAKENNKVNWTRKTSRLIDCNCGDSFYWQIS